MHISSEEIDEARVLFAKGKSHRMISRELGLTLSQVRYAIEGNPGGQKIVDPTPEEIEAAKIVLRNKHLDKKRKEHFKTDVTPRPRYYVVLPGGWK